MRHAIVICSGGLDSTTLAYHVKKNLNYKNLIILFFNYNQRNLIQERKASKFVAKKLNAEYKLFNLSELASLSTSLLNANSKVRKVKSLTNTKKEFLCWYVPLRNTLFLNYATALAESIKIKNKKSHDIFIGFKNEGEEFFPDTTPHYLKQMNSLNKLSTISKTKLKAPLIKKDKEDIIILANKLNVSLERTYSCYLGEIKHCGNCLACKLRKYGFYWANIDDHTKYLN